MAGRYGWRAQYLKEVDANETTLRFWQEIYDDHGSLVEIHDKYPVDTGHRSIREDQGIVITRETVACKLAAYLHHEISLGDLADWAQLAMMEGEFEDAHHDAIRGVVARLGLAEVRAFGLAWGDCETILKQLGYDARVEIVAL